MLSFSAQVLLEAEASKDLPDDRRPSMMQDDKKRTPLHYAVASGSTPGHVECTRLLVAAAPGAIRVQNQARLSSPSDSDKASARA